MLKVLFFCESVTLAHVARCRLLADHLHRDRCCEIVFYCDDHYDDLFSTPGYEIKPLFSTAPATFIEWNLKSLPIWPKHRVLSYLHKDKEILEAEKPALVIGDMRHTLQISAKQLSIPYLNVINGYWCSSRSHELPIPNVPIREVLGTALSQRIFNFIKPLLMGAHTSPFKQSRIDNGLMPVKSRSLPHIFCESDYTAYLDLPEIVDMDLVNDNKRAIGPVNWSPDIEVPSWWSEIPTNKPTIYINLGSSGDSQLLPELVDVLAKHKVTLIVGTASDSIVLSDEYDNVYWEKFIPGDKACEIADVSISNGGSPTTMQALASGIFSIGICFNICLLYTSPSPRD